MGLARNQRAYERFERAMEFPMLVAASLIALVTRLHPDTDGHRATPDPHPERPPEHAT